MTPEVTKQIGEWGTVYEVVRQNGFYVDGVFYQFLGLWNFGTWYEGAGYGGDSEYVEEVARSMIRTGLDTGFFHFITALKEEHTTPSEGAKNV